MHKSVDPAVVTDPPAVFNTDMVVGLIGSDYEDDLKAAFRNVMQQIDDYQHNGSGWGLNQFGEPDVSIFTYATFMGKDIDDDDDDYDEDNEGREGGEL